MKEMGFNWSRIGNVMVKGAFFDEKGNFYFGNTLASYFNKYKSYDDFLKLLKNCNGIFSVIIENGDETWCAVDRNISFPLFYSNVSGEYVVSDNVDFIVNRLRNIKKNKSQEVIYRSLGFTFGDQTLIENIYQVQCGEAVRLKNESKPDKSYYHEFSVNSYNTSSESELLKEGYQIFENSFKRLIKSLNGKTAVVPLSGGFDSRLIVAGLKKHNYDNVICYTYGKKSNNPEVELSKKVAKNLKYKWIFIEYDNKLFDNYNETKEFKDYVGYLSHLSSFFFLQEYFAVKYLKDNDLIPSDSVFVPGHSGDLLGGSQIIKVYDKDLNIKDVAHTFIMQKSIYKKLSKKDSKVLERLINKEVVKAKNKDGASVFEELDIREKISKLIFNSSLVYDFFGYEKRFPFWDLEVLNFFLSLPKSQREMKKLYDEILIEKYFKPRGIHFEKELQPVKSEIIKQKLKNKIKPILPVKIKIRLLKKVDWINYHEATMVLTKEMQNKNYKFYGYSFNEILLEYYLYYLKNHLT